MPPRARLLGGGGLLFGCGSGMLGELLRYLGLVGVEVLSLFCGFEWHGVLL